VNAVILAAGRGTRLGLLGRARPKVLFEIGGEPLLARHLRMLEDCGIKRVVVNAHHQATQIQAFVSSHSSTIEVVCVAEARLLGTAGGVRNAFRHLDAWPALIVYGDIFVDDRIEPLMTAHRRFGGTATLAVHEASSAEGKGVVDVDRTGRVRSFVEKSHQAEGPVLINSGIYVVERDLIAGLPEGIPLDFGHDVLPRAASEGVSLYAHRLRQPVIDIGTPEGLALARRRALSANAADFDRTEVLRP
jgi:mannose-1-phosphate guanylyltransferase